MTALPLVVALGLRASVELTAERVVHDDTTKLTFAEGGAALIATDAVLNAEHLTWNESTSTATAAGQVTARLSRNGPLVVIAEAAVVRLSGGEVVELFLHEGIALRKRGVSAEALRGAATPAQARALGTTTLSLQANHLLQSPDGEWVIDGLRLTPCDCDFEAPSWHIATTRTTLDLNAERASLLFPTVYVRGIPVLWAPWLSLPLSERQTGLLVPRPGFTALNGVSLEQPVFVTLGPSADLTFTPGYFFGGAQVSGIEGPRLLTEARYTPSAGTSGRATLGLIWDRKLKRNPDPTAADPAPIGRRGVRAEGSWSHLQEMGHGFHNRVNVSFLSDGYLQRDINPDVLAREAGYLRSTAALFHRGADHWLGLDAALRQDLSTGDTLFATRPGSPNPLARLPALTVAVPSMGLKGPLSASGRAELSRIGPLVPRADALTAYERLDVTPRLELGGVLADALSLSAFAAWRQTAWLAESSLELHHRGYPLLGARAETELSRVFGGQVRHSIAPSVELRSVPLVLTSGTVPQYDEIDGAVSSAATQAVVLVRQRIQLHGQGDLLRLDLGQSLHFVPSVTTGETFASLWLGAGLFRINGTVRVDPLFKQLTRASLFGSIDDGRGHSAYVSYESVNAVGHDRARQTVDLIVASRVPLGPAAQVLSFGGQWRVGGVALRYDSVFLDLNSVKWPTQQTVGVSYGPACDCWRIEAFGTYRPHAFPDLGASLTITGFGTIGSGG